MFYGRERELNELTKRYKSSNFEFLVIYGRRRVGKTELIKQFISGKKYIFFAGKYESPKDALYRMSQSVMDVFPELKSVINTFEDWDKLFHYIETQSGSERIVLVIDEYPYLASSDKSFSTFLQNRIDHYLKSKNIFLILCGSSIGFMEEEVLGYKSPLYGRRTGQMKIRPFNYYDSKVFFDGLGYEEILKIYGIIGGIPMYLDLFSKYKTVEEGIINLFLNEFGYLHNEASGLVQQELREPGIYNSILTAIATGSSQLNQISTKIGENNAKCSKYLKTLRDLHIVDQELPVGKKTKKGYIYKISDPMFRFWHRYIPLNLNLLEQGLENVVFQEKVKNDLDRFMGLSFESICKQYLIKMNGFDELPFSFSKIGSFWGNNPVEKKEIEIDIVAEGENCILLGECKWRKEKCGLKVLEALENRSGVIAGNRLKSYFLFSKSGFTEELHSVSISRKDVYLIDLHALFDI
jgi:AAA+ ATPase superfamily predicted ATPase